MAAQDRSGLGTAWQPITPGGVAAFAKASWARVLVCQVIFAMFCASAFVWFCATAIYPVITSGITRLPAQGRVYDGKLLWTGRSPELLVEGRVLSFVVDLEHSGFIRLPSDWTIEAGRSGLRVFSVAGYTQIDYPQHRWFPLNRPALEPLWGAWRAPILVMVFLGITLLFLAAWNVLAVLHLPVASLITFYANRHVTGPGAWRVCATGMLAPSLLLWLAVFLYATAAITLITLVLMACAHLALVWGWTLAGLLALPKDPSAFTARKNPFTQARARSR